MKDVKAILTAERTVTERQDVGTAMPYARASALVGAWSWAARVGSVKARCTCSVCRWGDSGAFQQLEVREALTPCAEALLVSGNLLMPCRRARASSSPPRSRAHAGKGKQAAKSAGESPTAQRRKAAKAAGQAARKKRSAKVMGLEMGLER